MSPSEIGATKAKSTFRQQCTVSADIQAPPEKIWALLTRPEDMTRWNSTLTSIEGNIELGGTVRMRVPEAPGRTFKVKVTRYVPNEEMVWRDGNPVMFLGVRTYSLTREPDGTATRFQMTEKFSGLMRADGCEAVAGLRADLRAVRRRPQGRVREVAGHPRRTSVIMPRGVLDELQTSLGESILEAVKAVGRPCPAGRRTRRECRGRCRRRRRSRPSEPRSRPS